MKQEKLCEAEDMTERDYSRYYADPVEQAKFNDDMGAENVKQMNNMYVDPKELEKFRQQLDPYTKPKVKTEANTRQVAGQHYKKMDIQPWDVIDCGPKQQAVGFYRYNALKYIMRAGEKGDFKEDIAKAQHYLEKLLEILE